MQAGQVSFHHCHLFHGSLANTSDGPRRNLIVHMQDVDNRYHLRYAEDGSTFSYNSDAACRKTPEGHPDYTDPDIFPVIFEER